MHEGLDQRDLPLVAVRQLVDPHVEVELQPLRVPVDPFARDAAPERREVLQVLESGESFVEAELARHVADPGPHRGPVRARVQAEHEDPPRRRPDEVERRADRGALAGAVGTEVAEHLARVDLEREIDHAPALPVGLREPAPRGSVRALPHPAMLRARVRSRGAAEVRRRTGSADPGLRPRSSASSFRTIAPCASAAPTDRNGSGGNRRGSRCTSGSDVTLVLDAERERRRGSCRRGGTGPTPPPVYPAP